MADQHQAWMEDTLRDPRYGGAAWCMPERKGKGGRRGNRPTLLRARDSHPSGDTRRTLHHNGSDGNQGVGKRFDICVGEEPGRSALCPIFDGSAKLRA